MLSRSCMPPLDLDPKFSAARRGFRSLWTMCDLADSLIGKANQIEASCHISFFSEFKKQKSQHSLAIRIARAAGSKLFFSYPLRRTSCVPLVGPHITWKPSRWWREVTSAPISPAEELSSRFGLSSD